VSQASGDFDGDGKADDLAVYAVPSGDERTPFRIRVTFRDGVVESELGATAPEPGSPELDQPPAFAVGGFDAAGTGRDLAFVQVEHGASTAFDGLFALRGCRLLPVTLPDGSPLRLASGGSTGHFDVYGCNPRAPEGPEITALSWIRNDADGTTYEVVRTVYRLDGTSARQVREERSTATPEPPGFPGPGFPGAESLRCGTLARP
jgi:hypothetical protein